MPRQLEDRQLGARLTLVAGACIGGVLFFWIAGLRVLTPTEFGWVMQGDWRIHFLGWHLFRGEPWQWPPGRISGYLHAPEGTAIGFTDSIPLVAFALKPLSGILPATFQYLGLWLLSCFVLQAVFGVLIARLWTPRRTLHLLSAALLVLMPTLLIRIGHPALCAHWLLLWAMWLYLRGERGSVQSLRSRAALGLVSGLTHPYLAVMVLALLFALAAKELLDVSGPSRARLRRRASAAFLGATTLIVAGWWASGLLSVSDAGDLSSEGLSRYSMNLLSPVAPNGWSTVLPEVWVAPREHWNEGFQYLGLGMLLLIAIGGVLALRRLRTLPWSQLWPLMVVTFVGAIYALSSRVMLGSHVFLDYTTPELDRLALFRASGRFFWPMSYLVVVSAIAFAVTRLPPRVSVVLMFSACVVQLVDLRGALTERYAANRSEYFHAHRLPLTSAVWSAALPYYRHLVLYPPQQCGRAPVSFEWPAYLAGLHGITINAGEVARFDADARDAYCRSLEADLAQGRVAEDSLYVVERNHLESFRARAAVPVTCGEVDRLALCVTTSSYQLWRRQASLQPL